MKDRNEDKDRMVHIRLTEVERRRLKSICAIKGVSMQEHIHELILKSLKRSGTDRK